MGMTKIGALWPGNKSIATGFIDWPKTRVVIMENKNPKGNSSPKWFLMAVDDEQQQGQQGQQPQQNQGFGGQPQQGDFQQPPQGGGFNNTGGGGGGWA